MHVRARNSTWQSWSQASIHLPTADREAEGQGEPRHRPEVTWEEGPIVMARYSQIRLLSGKHFHSHNNSIGRGCHDPHFQSKVGVQGHRGSAPRPQPSAAGSWCRGQGRRPVSAFRLRPPASATSSPNPGTVVAPRPHSLGSPVRFPLPFCRGHRRQPQGRLR